VPLSNSAKLLAALVLGFVVVFLIDPLDPSTLSTPFLLGILLMGLALREKLSVVSTISVLYSLLTFYALVQFEFSYSHRVTPMMHPAFWIFQRMGLFLLLCALSSYLAHYRTQMEQTLAHIQEILSKLPAPVVVSDAAGRVVYANDALGRIFGSPSPTLTGRRFVDVLMPDIQEGKAMRYYIEVFDSETNSVHELEMKPFDGIGRMNARLTCLGTGRSRVLVTVLQPKGA
jgi:PAS domain S-box-containing protein